MFTILHGGQEGEEPSLRFRRDPESKSGERTPVFSSSLPGPALWGTSGARQQKWWLCRKKIEKIKID